MAAELGVAQRAGGDLHFAEDAVGDLLHGTAPAHVGMGHDLVDLQHRRAGHVMLLQQAQRPVGIADAGQPALDGGVDLVLVGVAAGEIGKARIGEHVLAADQLHQIGPLRPDGHDHQIAIAALVEPERGDEGVQMTAAPRQLLAAGRTAHLGIHLVVAEQAVEQGDVEVLAAAARSLWNSAVTMAP